MNQWVSAVNSYYYPYMIYHVTHERLVFPELGIASNEKVVAHALPKVDLALGVMERELSHGPDGIFLSDFEQGEIGPDLFMLPAKWARKVLCSSIVIDRTVASKSSGSRSDIAPKPTDVVEILFGQSGHFEPHPVSVVPHMEDFSHLAKRASERPKS